MRLRGPKDSIDMLKEQDPETKFTLYALRTLIKQGKIKAVHAGANILIDFDVLLEYLQNPPAEITSEQANTKIRRIDADQKRRINESKNTS